MFIHCMKATKLVKIKTLFTKWTVPQKVDTPVSTFWGTVRHRIYFFDDILNIKASRALEIYRHLKLTLFGGEEKNFDPYRVGTPSGHILLSVESSKGLRILFSRANTTNPRQSLSFVWDLAFAEKRGFEPPRALTPYLLSKEAQSTTLTLLQFRLPQNTNKVSKIQSQRYKILLALYNFI